jgi:hypothetical protein
MCQQSSNDHHPVSLTTGLELFECTLSSSVLCVVNKCSFGDNTEYRVMEYNFKLYGDSLLIIIIVQGIKQCLY